jgi:hypothetical protein
MLEMYIVSLAFPWVDALLTVFSSIWYCWNSNNCNIGSTCHYWVLMVLTKQFNYYMQQMVLKQVLLSPMTFAGGTLANPVNLNYYMTGLFGY